MLRYATAEMGATLRAPASNILPRSFSPSIVFLTIFEICESEARTGFTFWPSSSESAMLPKSSVKQARTEGEVF